MEKAVTLEYLIGRLQLAETLQTPTQRNHVPQVVMVSRNSDHHHHDANAKTDPTPTIQSTDTTNSTKNQFCKYCKKKGHLLQDCCLLY